MLRNHPAAVRRQQGTSAIEFTLVAIPMLLAGLGAVELSRWFFVKQAISLALLEAGRAGITQHARPASIEAAFERALLPLFPATSRQSAAQRLQLAFEQRLAATGSVPWQIKVHTPNSLVFNDFAVTGLTVHGAQGLATIDNNYQAEQHERYKQQGRPNGRGAASGATIFEANNLSLHLTYMHAPLVPGVGSLLKMLSTDTNGYAGRALSGGYLPLRQTLQLTMQSHPVAWPHHSLKILTADQPDSPALTIEAGLSRCSGIWCPAQSNGIKPPGQEGTAPPQAGAPGGIDTSTQPPTSSRSPDVPDATGLPEADDGLCGDVLCCGG